MDQLGWKKLAAAIVLAALLVQGLAHTVICSEDAARFTNYGVKKVCFPIKNEEDSRIGDYCVKTEMRGSKVCVKGYFEVNDGYLFTGIKFGVHPDCSLGREIPDGPEKYSDEVTFEGDGVTSSEHFVCLDEIAGHWDGQFGCCNEFLCTTAEVMMTDESGAVGTYYPGTPDRCLYEPSFQCPVQMECTGRIPEEGERERVAGTIRKMEKVAASFGAVLQSLENKYQVDGTSVRMALNSGLRVDEEESRISLLSNQSASRELNEDAEVADLLIEDMENFASEYANDFYTQGRGECHRTRTGWSFAQKHLDAEWPVNTAENYAVMTWEMSIKSNYFNSCADWELNAVNKVFLLDAFKTSMRDNHRLPLGRYMTETTVAIKRLAIISDFGYRPTLKVEFHVFDTDEWDTSLFEYDAETTKSNLETYHFSYVDLVKHLLSLPPSGYLYASTFSYKLDVPLKDRSDRQALAHSTYAEYYSV